MPNPVTKASAFVDENLFTIRSSISLLLTVTVFYKVLSSRHGCRQTPANLKFHNTPLYGRFIATESNLKFYHEPLLFRLVRGRKKMDKILTQDCFSMPLKSDSKNNLEWNGKFGTLNIHKLNQNNVTATAKTRLKWYHWRRSVLSNENGQQ